MSYLQIADSYSESNIDSTNVNTSTSNLYGQVFEGDGRRLHSIIIPLARVNLPTGNIKLRIYNITGTVGTTGRPTGSYLAISDAIAISSLSTSQTLMTFRFNGVNRIELSDGTYYGWALDMSDATFSSSGVSYYTDFTDSTHPGNLFQSTNGGSTWAGLTGDRPFYVYTKPLKNPLPGNN